MSISRTWSTASRSTISQGDLALKTRCSLLANVLMPVVREYTFVRATSRTRDSNVFLDYLLYGRLYVPTGRLDALYSTRLSSTLQALVAAISDPRADLRQSQSIRTASSPSNVMFSLQHDTGRWCTEYTYSAEDSMLGVRMLHNFGKLALPGTDESATSRGGAGMTKRIDEEDAMEGGLKGRISAGAEIYFSAKEKSAGGHTPPSVHETKTLTYPTCVRQCRRVSGSPLSQTRRCTHPLYQSQSQQRIHCHCRRHRLPLLLTLPPSPNRRQPSLHSSTP